ncbi:MAG: hypothetical protein ACRDZ3_16175, partial [Acidimicrobiia bacterium]
MAVRSGAFQASDKARDPDQRYEVDAMVLQDRTHGPQLCAGDIAASLPPGCGGPDVKGFSWDDVEGEQSMSGTTWGPFHLVGTYDHHVFHLAERPSAPTPLATSGARDTSFDSPCPEPAGGWQATDRSRMSEADIEALSSWVLAQPDASAFWLSWLKDPNAGDQSYRDGVANLAFTGDLTGREDEARRRWGGPLCITHFSRT